MGDYSDAAKRIEELERELGNVKRGRDEARGDLHRFKAATLRLLQAEAGRLASTHSITSTILRGLSKVIERDEHVVGEDTYRPPHGEVVAADLRVGGRDVAVEMEFMEKPEPEPDRFDDEQPEPIAAASTLDRIVDELTRIRRAVEGGE